MLPPVTLICSDPIANVTYSLSLPGCPTGGKKDGGMHTSCFMNVLMLWTRPEKLMWTEVSRIHCLVWNAKEELRFCKNINTSQRRMLLKLVLVN